ncbi:MAG: hypothetical protein FJZ95_05410 [Chloroflexi bacterium]|nr:hypothetical protein [Chloroflexota bacterium]
MHRFPSLLLVVILLATVAWACGGGGEKEEQPTLSPTGEGPSPTVETPSPTGEQPPPTTAKPSPTGTLTVAAAMISVAGDLGPFTTAAVTARTYWAYIFDYLVYETRDQSGYIPGLAEEWHVSPDRTSVTFKLRKGVQFHNGWGELTADDVKFTFESAVNPDISAWAEAQTLFGATIDRIEVTGRYELTIYTKGAFAEEVLYYVCPTHQLALGIMPKAYYDKVGFEKGNENPIGSGPYKLVEYKQAERLVLEAVADHWRAVPEFKTLIFKEVPELSTRSAMIRAGEADIAEVSVEEAANLQGRGIDIVRMPDVTYMSAPLLGQWLPSAPTYDPDCPFLDKRVREALNLAINREEIAQHIYSGFARPVAGVRYTPWGDLLQPYPYDPDRAKQLLKDAGYEKGFKMQMWILAMPASLDTTSLMMAVAGYWEKIGVDVEISSFNVMAKYGLIVGRKTTGVCISFTAEKLLAPYAKAYAMWGYSKSSRFPQFESEATDAMIDKFLAATTPEERDGIAEQITRYYYDEYTFVPLVAVDMTWATSDKIGNFRPTMARYLNLEYVTHAKALGTFKLFEP